MKWLRTATVFASVAVVGWFVVSSDLVPLPFLTTRDAAIAAAREGRGNAQVLSARLIGCAGIGTCSYERWYWRVELDRGGITPSNAGVGKVPPCPPATSKTHSVSLATVWVGHWSGKIVQEDGTPCPG